MLRLSRCSTGIAFTRCSVVTASCCATAWLTAARLVRAQGSIYHLHELKHKFSEIFDTYLTLMKFALEKRTIKFACLDNGCKICARAKAVLGDACPIWLVGLMHAEGHVLVRPSAFSCHVFYSRCFPPSVLPAGGVHAVCRGSRIQWRWRAV